MLSLVVVAMLAQSEYPKVVRKDDGSTCLQSLNDAGEVLEQCRKGGAADYSAPVKVQDAPVVATPETPKAEKKRPKVLAPPPSSFVSGGADAPVTYSRNSGALLDPKVADALSSAMTKKGWSGAFGLTGILTTIAGGVMLGAGAQTGGKVDQTPGTLTLGLGVAMIGVSVLLHVSANSDIESVTQK